MKSGILLIISFVFTGIILNAYGESIDEMHDLAFEYMNAKDFVNAIEEYSNILEVNSDDEDALMNRAYAFTMTGDYELGIRDLSKVLENDPDNLIALKGKATLLAQFECKSYNDCRPNEALEILDIALDNYPNDEDLKMKRDYLLSKAELFNVLDTNGDYIVNIQFITRDQNGSLVSVIENSRIIVLPSRVLENYLDEKKEFKDTLEFKKEIVKIEGDDYMKWHIVTEHYNDDRFWRGVVNFEKRVDAVSDEGYQVTFFKDILRAIMPAEGHDKDYETLSIMEFFKKI
tara:strand:+ start:118 stop:981 length:864 start_codon:yes stop_codon:yes gene_type:complete